MLIIILSAVSGDILLPGETIISFLPPFVIEYPITTLFNVTARDTIFFSSKKYFFDEIFPTRILFATPIAGLFNRTPRCAASPIFLGCNIPCPSKIKTSGSGTIPFRASIAASIGGASRKARYPGMYGKNTGVIDIETARISCNGRYYR